MKQSTVNGLKNAGMQIGLHGLLIPALGTLVGYFVQKKLIQNEQKKAIKQQQGSTNQLPETVGFDD